MENKIKEEFDKYTIKTTSQDILNRYENETTKKRFNFKLLIPIMSCALACVVVMVFIFNSSKAPLPRPLTGTTSGLKDSTIFGELSFDLYFGCSITQSSTTTKKMRKLSNTEGFAKVIDEIHETMLTINALYERKEGFKYTYESTSFAHGDIEYNYILTVDEYKLYLTSNLKNDDNETQQVLINIGNSFYEGLLEFEQETDEVEMKLSYIIGNQQVIIEKEIEQDEYSYEYTIYQNNQLIETKKISIETEEELEITFEHITSSKEVKLQIEKEDSYILQYEKKTNNTSISYDDIEVIYGTSSITYIYDGVRIEK